jgi:hypothetical protein
MPMDVMINKKLVRLFPTPNDQTIKIAKHSLIEVLDKEFYIKMSLTPEENQP